MSESIADRIYRALHVLGATPSDIAQFLWAVKCKGIPTDAACCPVARYLTSVLPDIEPIVVSSSCVAVPGSEPGQWIETPLPSPVARFVEAFDHYSYPKLVARTYEEVSA